MTHTTDTTTMPDLISPPVAVPCPAWCDRMAGHGYEIEDNAGRPGRFHQLGTGSSERVAFADIAAEAFWIGGNEEVAQAFIDVVIRGDVHPNRIGTADEARTLAESLLCAAEQLEAIR